MRQMLRAIPKHKATVLSRLKEAFEDALERLQEHSMVVEISFTVGYRWAEPLETNCYASLVPRGLPGSGKPLP